MSKQEQSVRVCGNQTMHSVFDSCYFGGIALIILYYGGVYELSRGIGLALISLSGAGALVVGDYRQHRKSVLGVAVAILVVLLGWISIQRFLPMQLESHSLWQSAAGLGLQATPYISVSPSDTLGSMLELILPFMVFINGLIVFKSDEHVRTVVRMTSYASAAIVIFGLIQFIAFPKTLLYSEKNAYISSLTSVFVNRNTAGTFLSLIALLFFARFCELAASAGLKYNLDRFSNGLSMKFGRIHLDLLVTILMFLLTILSLFLTQSRGAMLSFGVSFTILLILLTCYPIDIMGNTRVRRRSSPVIRILRLMVGLAVILAIGLLFGGRTLLRAQVQGTDDGRLCVFPGIFEMANDRWLTGWGFGTFRNAFAPYRDPLCGVNGLWVRAHNAYLEAYAGLGFIFWPILALGVGTLLSVYWRGIRKRRSMKIYAHVGLCALILTLIHSAVDFSIQIPGYAVAFAFFCALTVTVSSAKQRKNAAPPQI